jgi:hypothetical protein
MKPRTLLPLATIALLIPVLGLAQETPCAISGTVVARSVETGAFVDGAEVSLPRQTRSTTSDATGAFRLAAIPCGKQEIQVRKIGFTVWRDTVDLTAVPELKRSYTLIAVAQLDTVRTTADEIAYQTPRLQDFEDRRKRNVGGYFTSEAKIRELDNAGASLPSILRRMPGVTIVPYNGQMYVKSRSNGAGDQPLCQRPGCPKGCWAPIYLDGLLIFDGQLDSFRQSPPDISQYFPLNLSGIEYYPSAGSIPLQFKTTKSQCGVLLLWTRAR